MRRLDQSRLRVDSAQVDSAPPWRRFNPALSQVRRLGAGAQWPTMTRYERKWRRYKFAHSSAKSAALERWKRRSRKAIAHSTAQSYRAKSYCVDSTSNSIGPLHCSVAASCKQPTWSHLYCAKPVEPPLARSTFPPRAFPASSQHH